MANKGLVRGIVVGAFLLVGSVVMFKCTEKIHPGYIGVVYNVKDGINGETLGKGWHFVAPWKEVTQYSIALEQSYLVQDDKGDSKKDESFNIPTSDGKTLNVDLEFSYRFDPDRITHTFETFKGKDGDTIKDTFIKPKISAWTQEVSSKYPVTDVFGDKRQELNQELDDYLKQKFDPYGILIDTVNFTRIETDKETTAAIQKKVTAQQEQELANIEAETARINAEKDKEVALIAAEKDKETAQINAEQEKIKAEGEATATKIKAQAEADANKMIAESLSKDLIEQNKINKWNGTVPQVQGSNQPIVDLR